MITVTVSDLAWVREHKALDTLNRIANIHSEWTPRLIRGATGCRDNEAMAFLWFLYNRNAAKPILIVYHQHSGEDMPLPIMRRSLFEGPPQVPFQCEECEQIIFDQNELSYEVIFELVDEIKFA